MTTKKYTLWEKLFDHQEQRLLNEELFSTWVASAILVSVLGTEFSARDDVSVTDRQTVDFLFLSISCIMLIWAGLSYYNLISHFLHRFILLIILLVILAELFYIMFLVSQARL